jgi:hypothetical protein
MRRRHLNVSAFEVTTASHLILVVGTKFYGLLAAQPASQTTTNRSIVSKNSIGGIFHLSARK